MLLLFVLANLVKSLWYSSHRCFLLTQNFQHNLKSYELATGELWAVTC